MSLVVLNSLNENPHHFYNTFSDPIQLPRNARVCCQGYSFVRKELGFGDISGNVIINDDNNTITWMLNDPNVNNGMVLPLEKCEIPSKAYYGGNDLLSLRNAINLSLSNAELVSTYKGGLTTTVANSKLSFSLSKRRPKEMGPGNWISTNGDATVEEINAAPDIQMKYIAEGSQTVFLAPGQINNTNGFFQFAIGQATLIGIHTTDAQGVNQAAVLAQQVGKVLLCNSGGGTIGRETTFSKFQILNIAGTLPAGTPPSSASHILFDVVCLDQNLNIANPSVGYNGTPFNWFTTEDLLLTFVNDSEKKVAHLRNTKTGVSFLNTEPLFNCDVVDNSGQNLGVQDCSGYLFHLDISGTGVEVGVEVESEFGITCNRFVNYNQEGIHDANKDWELLQTKVVIGARIDTSGNVLLAKTPLPKPNQIQSNTTTTIYKNTGINLFDGITPLDTKIMFRPVVDENKYKIQMLVAQFADISFNHVDFVEITDDSGDMPLYHNLPLYACATLSEFAFPQQFMKCSAVYHKDSQTGSGTLPSKWAMGFGYTNLDGTQSENSRWLNWVNTYANSKGTLGFVKSSYTINNNGTLTSDTGLLGEIKSNPSILVNLEGLPITSFVGSANYGQSSPVIAVAHREPEIANSLIHKNFPFENWIHLNNRTPLTITRLGIRLTDVELKNLDCFDKSTSIWLKFSNDDKDDDTFKLN